MMVQHEAHFSLIYISCLFSFSSLCIKSIHTVLPFTISTERVEIVMLEKLDCSLSKRATRPIYMRVQVRLNAISPYQSQQSSPAIRDTSAPPIRGSSPAETCICNTPPSCYALWSKKQTNKQTNMMRNFCDSHSSLLETLLEK